MIWFTSDTHYNHKNIVAGACEWEDKSQCRPFATLEEHNKYLVDTFNRLVKAEDTLYHLGDWSFGGFQAIREFREQLNCKNIHLILGNHDHHIERNKDNIQSLFSSVQHYKEISISNYRIIMSHYPFLSWNHASKGSLMLHGHEHSQVNHLNYALKRIDVGIDSAYIIYNQYTPILFDQIISITADKGYLILGNHK